MEVTHLEDSQNHVVIGGGQSRSFAIATTAEFVTVLSDALYTDKELAVVREVICNAWDSHIVSGIEDTPVLVELTENKLSIRDYGAGIHDDYMEEIYCIYGESTKRHQSATTGGFGLGSKAPFAVSEAFSVTSFHQGKKTVYAISKGSEDTDGLPELRTIVSLPTSEQGLLVEVPIDPKQYFRMRELIPMVVTNGEMNVKFIVNGYEKVKINKLNLKNADDDFVIVNKSPVNHRGQSVFVQYGSVIYPVTFHEDLADNLRLIDGILNSRATYDIVPKVMDFGYIIVKAKPNSLSIAPSREALSYNKTCVANINILLENLIKSLQKKDMKLAHEAMTNKYNQAFESNKVKELKTNFDFFDLVMNYNIKFINYKVKFNNIDEYNDNNLISLSTTKDKHLYYLASRYKFNNKMFYTFMHKKMYKYLKSIKQSYWAKQFKKRWFYPTKHKIDTFHITYDMRKVLIKSLINKYGKNIFKYLNYIYKDYYEFKFLTSSFKINTYKYSKLNAFDIIVANNKTSIKNYKNIETNDLYPALIIPKTQKQFDAEDVADTLEILGFNVHRVYADESLQPVRSVPSTTAKTGMKLKGYALLSDCIVNGQYDESKFATATRIENPEAVVYTEISNSKKRIYQFNEAGKLKDLVDKFPNTIVVSSSSVAHNASVKHSIVSGYYKIINELKNLTADNDFIEYCASIQALKENTVYSVLCTIPEIANEFNFKLPIKSDRVKDKQFYDRWIGHISWTDKDKFNVAVKLKSEEFSDKFSNLALVKDKINYLEMITCIHYLDVSALNADKLKVLTSMIRIALKG